MEYHKIETLYERDLTGAVHWSEKTYKLNPELILKNPIYGVIKTWHWTEKIDGTNVRCIWNHAEQKVSFAGRTDKAQIHADLVRWLYRNVSNIELRQTFPDVDVIIYGEGYGAGIQKGGGDYSPTKKLVVFDILVVDSKNSCFGGWWLNWENTCDVARKLSLETVPYLGEMRLEKAVELVRTGFPSQLNHGKARAEGIVGRTFEALFDKKGHRLITKLKTKDF